MSRVSALLVLCAFAAATCAAGGQRGHAAHVHGVATLNLAVDGAELYLELHSPAMNLFGFEHPPRNAEERSLVGRVQSVLGDAAQLFVLPEAAGCRQADSGIGMPWRVDEPDHAEASSTHRAEHPHDEDERHAPHHADAAHADVHAEFRFVCEKPAALDRMEALVFEAFPTIQRLEVQTVTPSGQAAVVLMPGSSLIRL